MPISRLLREGHRIFALELAEASRSLKSRARDSPVLYSWFSIIIAFSVIMAARLTVFEMDAKLPVDMDQIFMVVFFLFMLKASADIHRYFVTSRHIEYLFASPVRRTGVSLGIFSMIFWVNLGLWALFSSSYIVLLHIYHVPIGYPELYAKFTGGVVLSMVLGAGVGLHYFSARRRHMLIPVLFMSALWYFHEPWQIALLILASIPYLIWLLHMAPNSFGYIIRKERGSAAPYSKVIRDPVQSLRWKEMTVLWRDRLVTSFVFTSVMVGFLSGYLAINMDPNIFPPEIRPHILPHLPFIFLFLGAFILASYLFVFPGLNIFLAEEDTLWILKNLPISGRAIVTGKLGSLVLPFIAALSFPFYFAIYTGYSYLPMAFAILILSFFLSLAIALPFGIRYSGKRSDVLLLYSVSIVIFTLISIGSYGIKKGLEMGFPGLLLVIFLLDWSAFLLYLSVHLSGRMMDKKWV